MVKFEGFVGFSQPNKDVHNQIKNNLELKRHKFVVPK
jgi:hypothetical protein